MSDPTSVLVRFAGGPWHGQTQWMRLPLPRLYMVATTVPMVIPELHDGAPPSQGDLRVDIYQLDPLGGHYQRVG